MLFVTLLAVPFFLTGRKVSRAEGTVWLLLYLGYLGYLVATQV
jgi:cation:H+ antiporter